MMLILHRTDLHFISSCHSYEQIDKVCEIKYAERLQLNGSIRIQRSLRLSALKTLDDFWLETHATQQKPVNTQGIN